LDTNERYHILTGSWRAHDQLEVWDYRKLKQLRSIKWEGAHDSETAYVYASQFSKLTDQYILAGCSRKNEVKLFDTSIGYQPVSTITHIEKPVYTVDFANRKNMFAFAGGDK